MAAGGDRCGQRPRQRPLAGPGAIAHLVVRHPEWSGPAAAETVDLIFNQQSDGIDLVLGMPARWGIGYGLPKPEAVPDIPDEKICFWGGWGGSMVVMNPDRRTTFAYVMNKMGQVTAAGSDRTQQYTRLIYQALDSAGAG